MAFYGERASGVREEEETSNNTVRLRFEKKGNPGCNQRRRVLRHETHLIRLPAKETHPNKHASLVPKLSVTNFIAHYQYDIDQ
jgi:hypothetical protein